MYEHSNNCKYQYYNIQMMNNNKKVLQGKYNLRTQFGYYVKRPVLFQCPPGEKKYPRTGEVLPRGQKQQQNN